MNLRLFASQLTLIGICSALLMACEQSPVQGSSGIEESNASRRDALADSPTVFGQLGEFELLDQEGRKVTRADLMGKPFALAFIFTTCTGPCPVITSNLVRLQADLKDTDVQLVTLSVDPEYDTPEVLKQYAIDLGADTSRWRLLTGPEQVIDELIVESMYLAVGRQAPSEDFPIGMHVSHSSKLVVFDRQCQIRGYYSGVTADGLEATQARLRFLERKDS